jgi:hypothetical protein
MSPSSGLSLFARNTYLEWYLPRLHRDDHPINLHASGVRAFDLDTLARPEGDPWSMATGFEAALARHLALDPAEVIFTPGATGGTLLALLTLGRPAAGTLVEQPIYEPMLRQAERLGPVFRLPRRPATGYRLDLETAERRLHEGASVVLITEPHNPSGVLSPRADVEALARLAARHQAWLVVNEVYRGFTTAPSLHGLANNVVVVSSLSKLCGAYLARLGWLSGSATLIRSLRVAHCNLGMAAGPTGAVGIALVPHLAALTDEARQRSATSVDRVDRWVQETQGVQWTRPDGPGFGCVRLPPGVDDVALAETLHDQHGVLVVPGSLWECPGSLRVSWLQASAAELDQGLDRIASVLATLA